MKTTKTLILALAMACSLGAMAQGYSVRGTVNNGFDGKWIYLAHGDRSNFTKTDSTQIDGNRFTFEGTVDQPQVICLMMGERGQEIYSDFILENAILAVSVNIGKSMTITVMGTAANNGYNDYKEAQATYRANVDPLLRQRTDPQTTEATRDSLRKLVMGYNETISNRVVEIMNQNASNFTGLLLLRNYYTQWDVARTKAILEQLPEELHEHNLYKQIAQHVNTVESTSVGHPYVDIAGKTPEGKDIKLSDYVGRNKVVLVDFWASWCGPCINEMPTVIKAYELYKDKGLEIVGYSLDNKSANWEKALVEHKMTWPQMSDLQGWSAQGAGAYAVRAIPATVLIDQDGTIVARNLRGENLLNKLGEMLN